MSGELPDPRRHAYRVGLAEDSLRGHVDAPRYVAGVRRQIEAPALPLRREPRFDATLDTEALLGETLTVFDESEGWAWVQLARDGYVGYMPSEGLLPRSRRRRTRSLRSALMSIRARLQDAGADPSQPECAPDRDRRRGEVPGA